MSDKPNVEFMVRKVLCRELRLSELRLEQDLIAVDPDLPTEELVKDVLEEFGVYGALPAIEDWNGTLKDLFRIVDRELEANSKGMGVVAEKLPDAPE